MFIHKNNNKTRKKGGAVIGSGGFGCILRPALKCKGSKERSTTRRITKLSKKKYAVKEYGEITKYKPLLEKIPNYTHYFLIEGFELCQPKPLQSEDLKEFNEECSALQKMDINESNVNKSLDKLMAINMPYGGIEVGQYIEKYSERGSEDKLVQLNNRLIELLEKGVVPMNAKNIYHCDLKASNILVDESRRREDFYTRIIDWGLSAKYTEGHPIPDTLLNRPFQYNVPFSNILFTDLFDDMYKKFLKNKAEDEINYHTLRIFVMNYVIAWVEKRGPGHLKTINSIFKKLFDKDITTKESAASSSEKSDIIKYQFTFHFIFEYLTQILLTYTDKGTKKFKKMEYFNEVFIKNIDIWGFCTIYIPLLEYLHSNYKTLSPLQEKVVLKIKELMLVLLDNSDKPIKLMLIQYVLHSMNEALPYINNVNSRKYKKRLNEQTNEQKEDFSAGSIHNKDKDKDKDSDNSHTKKTKKRKFHKMIVRTLKNIKSLHSRNEWM